MAKRRFLAKTTGSQIICGTYCIVTLATIFFDGGGAEAAATPADISALLRFKAAIVDHEGYLQKWRNDTDPCVDAWPGVWCDCEAAEKKTGVDLECVDVVEGEKRGEAIIALKPKCDSCRWLRFKGTIAPEIANITTLRLLDLSEHSFEGDIPTELQKLEELRFLSLRDNKLNGTLPDFFGKLTKLKTLELDRNYFSGPIPEKWCVDGFNSTRVTLQNNPGLCGTIPPCIKNPIVDFTYISRKADLQEGICDTTPPVCSEKNGCKISVPKYWIHEDIISFGFDEFEDRESNMTGYSFSVALADGGGRAGQEVVSDMQLEAARNLKIEIINRQHPETGEKRRYYNVKHYLTGVGLASGARFKVTVTGTNGAGPPLTTAVTSDPVTTDFTGPLGGSTVFNRVPVSGEKTQEAGQLGVSWIPFEDKESNISSVSVQLVEVDEKGSLEKNVTAPISVPESQNTLDVNAELKADTLYQFEVRAINRAGIGTTRSSQPFL
ncbi:hypothetical protein BSKO_06316 [Bryopsis sp. KO-2023]|nr:hypothetical protein BSKO_06316 [Bryopsis sp. KO-2023]